MALARRPLCFLEMAYSKLGVHVILSRLTDGRSQLKLDHSLPTECAGGFRTARWNLALLAARSQAPDFQATQLQTDEEIHARCEGLIASEGRLRP
jgi:hypothetical protein